MVIQEQRHFICKAAWCVENRKCTLNYCVYRLHGVPSTGKLTLDLFVSFMEFGNREIGPRSIRQTVLMYAKNWETEEGACNAYILHNQNDDSPYHFQGVETHIITFNHVFACCETKSCYGRPGFKAFFLLMYFFFQNYIGTRIPVLQQ